ncbi:MAG TPA: beta-N-acetylhexosaminidase [Gemmatimonadaceae bacterium]|nr:beta-N-acetylhexosaminidase [Gemmatimonadaceae bacterium]
MTPPAGRTARLLTGALILAACRTGARTAPSIADRAPYAVVPNPTTIEIAPGRDSFLVTPRTAVVVDANASPEVEAVATYTAQLIAPRFGVMAQRLAAGAPQPDSSVALTLESSRTALGAEGYELTVGRTQVRIVAARPAGLFYGVQTMRQLLPPSVEHIASYTRRLVMPAAHVVDAPRFEWRGAMLDVARHFLSADDVKHFVDLFALYKLNRLHLHLADDQGWRIEIKSWPNLTAIGGKTAIGDAPAGFYTQEQYADIVAYARSRYITVVPEIDMPGHINAALVSYPDLRCDRVAPEPFTRVGGPPNTLCVTRDSIYNFVSDVIREISSAAPSPYYHIGGDEVARLTKEQYRSFIERTESIVNGIGPRMVGWGEIATANITPRSIVQHWNRDSSYLHAQRGGKLILSPGPRAYLDMKYDSTTILGLRWAGLIDLRTAYDWSPTTLLPGVADSSILGLEAPLWAETLVTRQDYEYLAFPRLAAIAELAWSAPSRVAWDDFRRRIGAHGARLAALGVNFARVPGVLWSW